MNIKKILKIIAIIVAIAGAACAIYFAVKKFLAPKEVEYFDDNDFFECDNELEIIESKAQEDEAEEAPAEEKPAPKKKPAKKAEEE
jgi:flagellar basal body-associated protein FliL